METAGNDNLIKGIKVEKKGLGTPATRANIIENLIDKEFIKREKKNLLITQKGKRLLKLVSEDFKLPKTTAEWEMKLANIANGKESSNEFLDSIKLLIKEEISKA